MGRIKSSTVGLAIVFISFFFVSLSAEAYEVETHREISEKVFELNNDETADNKVIFTFLKEAGFDGNDYRLNVLQEVFGQGAVNEDMDVFYRPFNHFYDPAKDRALTIEVPYPFPSGYPVPVVIGDKAHEWALELNGVEQERSLQDAYQFYKQALLAPEGAYLKNSLENTFNTLGYAVHLLEDMAQPQHTRTLRQAQGNRTII